MKPPTNNISEPIQNVNTDSSQGLSQAQATGLLQQHGANRLSAKSSRAWWTIAVSQFNNLLVLLLVGASALSFQLGSYRDGIVLAVIVIVNALIGFNQDWKSENILQSLKNLITDNATVIRDGRSVEVPVEDLVPGDIVMIHEGDGVAADMRLLESNSLSSNEFILTGESQASEKDHNAEVKDDVSIASRINTVFMGTTIVRGQAKGLVIGTGMNTEIGKIAQNARDIEQDVSPLQNETNLVAKKITVITLILGASLFAFSVLVQDATIGAALVFAISIAAAMVPSGLPAQISIALAVGVRRLAQKNAVVKQLSSVEALGSATVIASDKTGTITKNEMTINNCIFNGPHFIISGTGYAPDGHLQNSEGHTLTSQDADGYAMFFAMGYLSSNSSVNPPDEFHDSWYCIGDPTEGAFGTLALKSGSELAEMEIEYPRLKLFPFDSHRKRISVMRMWEGKPISFVKGSIESILEISSQQIISGNVSPISDAEKQSLMSQAEGYASEALRVIAIGYKELNGSAESWQMQDTESDLIFAGFATMFDPPRYEVAQAVQDAFAAHMRLIMITGDNEVTARAVANNIGLVNADQSLPEVINQERLGTMSDDDIKQAALQRTLFFSRVSPDDKLKVASLLKSSGDVVAVTGDGVNDTLSLKKADIGVAMGRSGSKVAQEAAAMVLLDDNFSTIVHAVSEGRTIFSNIRKNVEAILTSNTAELICVLYGFVGIYMGLPVAILAIHILLIDLVGEMLPLLMLSFDPAHEGIMLEPPRKKRQLLDGSLMRKVLLSGMARGVLAISAFTVIYHLHDGDQIQHQTAVTGTFITIILTQFVNIFCIRFKGSMFNAFLFANPKLLWGMLISFLAMLAITYVPFFNLYLHTGPLSMQDWLLPVAAILVYMFGYEMIKWFTNGGTAK